MDADGSKQTPLTNNDAFDTNPTWSPDGSMIAFASDRDVSSDIYVMKSDGSNPVRLTDDPADDWWPTWLPAPVQ